MCPASGLHSRVVTPMDDISAVVQRLQVVEDRHEVLRQEDEVHVQTSGGRRRERGLENRLARHTGCTQSTQSETPRPVWMLDNRAKTAKSLTHIITCMQHHAACNMQDSTLS